MMNIVNRFTNWYFSKRALPYWGVLFLDCLIVVLGLYLGAYAELGWDVLLANILRVSTGVGISLLVFVLMFRLRRTYSGVLRYSSFVDLMHICMATTLSTAVLLIGSLFANEINTLYILHFKGAAVVFVFVTMLMFSLRVCVKVLYDLFRHNEATKNAFIYGVKEGGIGLAKSLRDQTPVIYNLKGFVSPDGDMEGNVLMSVKVHGVDSLMEQMERCDATCLLVSPLQTADFRKRNELITALVEKGVKIMMMPTAEEWDGKSDLRHTQLHEVEIEDLLPREKIEVDMDAIGRLLSDQTILITGAAGSIGSEMVRQVAIYKPKQMVLIDLAETPMHDVRLMMARQFADVPVETIVTSITDTIHMEKLFAEYRPDFVFHAAAYKHVPMMEDNPAQAVRNNVYGTRVIADLAVKYRTKKFVMISTDKAVNPTNVMGCSKRICEIYCQSLNNAIAAGKVEGCTQFVTTRFGNVLGSNGSVIPIFREQIKKGGPITVTHPDIIRFFMLIPEACRLVLEAGTMGKGGEIFVFDMGEPVRIVDLAKRMISLSGAKHVKIEFTGLRDGEKLYEEVLNEAETTKPTIHPKIKIASVREYDYDAAKRNEDELYQLSFTHDDMKIVAKMKEIVPEYKSQQSKYEILDK